MRLAPLIPVVILGAILFQGMKGLREKAASLMGFGGRVKAQKQLTFIRQRVERRGEAQLLSTLDSFEQQKWIKRWVPDPDGKKRDMSLDPWGTPIRIEFLNQKLTVTSAGKDKVYKTSDDIKESVMMD